MLIDERRDSGLLEVDTEAGMVAGERQQTNITSIWEED